MKFSKVQDSITILLALQLVIEDCLAVIKKERDEDSKIRPLIKSMLLVYANSFMKEWEHLGVQCYADARLAKVRRIANPLIRRIRQWTDLSAFRNTFLAHNFRDSKGNNVLIKGYGRDLNIPNSLGDFLLLCGCVSCAKQILVMEFAVEYNELLPHLKAIVPPSVNNDTLDLLQARKELDALIEHSKSIRSELSHPLD